LAQLLGDNLPNSQIFHEILGYDRFGVDTPDVSHMTLFNSQGNVKQVRDFWRQKAARIVNSSPGWYGETSHLLAKCGLLENIDLFTSVGPVYILCLDRDLLSLVQSMRRRHDMVNKGDQWLWHLDPDYPRKLVSKEFFVPYGVDGIRLWYGCEMRVRAAYYRKLLEGVKNLQFMHTTIEALSDRNEVEELLSSLEPYFDPQKLDIPDRSNVSVRGEHEEDEPLSELIRQMTFDPSRIASDYLAKGYQLGIEGGK